MRGKKGKDFRFPAGSHGIMQDTKVLVQIINTCRSQKPGAELLTPGKDLQFLFCT